MPDLPQVSAFKIVSAQQLTLAVGGQLFSNARHQIVAHDIFNNGSCHSRFRPPGTYVTAHIFLFAGVLGSLRTKHRHDGRENKLRNLENKVAWVGRGDWRGRRDRPSGSRYACGVVRQTHGQARRSGSKCGGYICIEMLDVADKDAVTDVAQRIIATHGRIDVLVASAGINVKNRNWHNVSLDDWDSVIRIDLDGAFYCCKAVLPTMKRRVKA